LGYLLQELLEARDGLEAAGPLLGLELFDALVVLRRELLLLQVVARADQVADIGRERDLALAIILELLRELLELRVARRRAGLDLGGRRGLRGLVLFLRDLRARPLGRDVEIFDDRRGRRLLGLLRERAEVTPRRRRRRVARRGGRLCPHDEGRSHQR
jgi:hypothetical protein